MSTLTRYLHEYYKLQEKILLVYREYSDSGWGVRHFFLGDNYCATVPYNHRSILDNEVVIEYDFDDKELNKKYADEVAKRLHTDGFTLAKWWSGNKSVHVHILIDPRECTNVTLLKKVVVRHYTEGLPLPDLQLAAPNHLIRAEYGVHEKTGQKKTLISKDRDYPQVSRLPQAVWDRYKKEQTFVMRRKTSRFINDDILSHPGVKHLLATHEFSENEDGRERGMFILIHAVKSKYKEKNELIEFITQWYKYSGGKKLTEQDIKNKVNYHWSRTYYISDRYINEFLESLGRSDLIKSAS